MLLAAREDVVAGPSPALIRGFAVWLVETVILLRPLRESFASASFGFVRNLRCRGRHERHE
jgi:hypothetical protein